MRAAVLLLSVALLTAAGCKPDPEPCDEVLSFEDGDGDGAGEQGTGALACGVPEGRVTNDLDCDDARADAHPDAIEQCNEADDDCDGLVDDADAAPVEGAPAWYADADGDQFGDPAAEVTACEAPSGFVADATDCDDARPDEHPGAPEICDGRDNDCDGLGDDEETVAPDGSLPFFADADGDGFGDPSVVVEACEAPLGHVRDATDCDDLDVDVFPGADETCNGLDDDCDGDVDDADDDLAETDAVQVWLDDDEDGWGSGSPWWACDAGSDALVDGDCDDSAVSVNPGAIEDCNGLDDDCDGGVDLGLTPPACDEADLGVCIGATDGRTCLGSAGWSDCDYGGEFEPVSEASCDDLDNDCDGVSDEGFVADCSGLVCGPDPVCGDSCGTCTSGEVCASGACVPSTTWIAEIDGSPSLGYDAYVTAVVPLSDGSFVAGGTYYGDVTFGAGEPNELTTDYDESIVWWPDAFVARYGADGSLQWVTTHGGDGQERVWDIAVMSDDSVVVAGSFERSATFGRESAAPVTLSTSDPTAWHADMFLMRIDSDGELVWVRSAGHGTDTKDTRARSVDVFDDDTIVAVGDFFATATFGAGEASETTLTGSTTTYLESWVAAYTTEGALSWVTGLGISDNDEPDVAVSASGEILVAGYWGLVRMDGSGGILTTVTPTGDFVANTVAAFDDGSAVLGGHVVSGTVTFGAGETTETTLSQGGFVARYDASGGLVWAKALTPSFGIAYVDGVSVTAAGEVGAVGEWYSSYECDLLLGAGETNEETLADSWPTVSHNTDLYFAEFDGGDGTYVAGRRFTSAKGDPRVSSGRLLDDGAWLLGGYLGEETVFFDGTADETTVTPPDGKGWITHYQP